MASPTNKANTGSRPRRWLLAGSLLVVILLAIVAFYVLHRATAEPEFYREVLIATPANVAELKPVAQELEAEIKTVERDLREQDSWRLAVSAAEINAWIALNWNAPNAPARSRDISEPRVVIDVDRIRAAARVTRGLSGVLSLSAKPTLTDQTNEIEIHLTDLQLGLLPLPVDRLIEPLRAAIQRERLPLEISENEKGLVANLRLPERWENFPNRKIHVTSLALEQGNLVIEGTAEAVKKK